MFSVSMLCCLALASAAVTIGGLLSQHYYPAVIAGLITLLLVPAIAENMLEKRRRKKSAAKEPPPAPKRTHTQSSRSPSRSASKSIRAVEGQNGSRLEIVDPSRVVAPALRAVDGFGSDARASTLAVETTGKPEPQHAHVALEGPDWMTKHARLILFNQEMPAPGKYIAHYRANNRDRGIERDDA
jgi:hypothetical protein